MSVTYNGESNNLTGQGSPNPVKLTLPSLNEVKDPAVKACLLRIQQFVNNLVAPTSGGGGGVYASLTGTGETTTPGKLTQDGDFTISDVASAGNYSSYAQVSNSIGIIVHSSVPESSIISMSSNDLTLSSKDVSVFLNGATGQLSLDTFNGAGFGPIRFFDNATGATRQTITGSRGGNAALASLLTALGASHLGLINDSTTP